MGNSQAFEALGNFFAALNALARKPAIHVLHYGDSQIGDRITGHLRNAWQSVWEAAPGFLSRYPHCTLAMRQSWNGERKRYARFGKKDTTIQHNRFGLMAAFAQPVPPQLIRPQPQRLCASSPTPAATDVQHSTRCTSLWAR